MNSCTNIPHDTVTFQSHYRSDFNQIHFACMVEYQEFQSYYRSDFNLGSG